MTKESTIVECVAQKADAKSQKKQRDFEKAYFKERELTKRLEAENAWLKAQLAAQTQIHLELRQENTAIGSQIDSLKERMAKLEQAH